MMEPKELLRRYWNDFCDCDPIPIARDLFVDVLEKDGLITLRKVTKHDLDEAFAWERGIEKGGMMWSLTKQGLDALKKDSS